MSRTLKAIALAAGVATLVPEGTGTAPGPWPQVPHGPFYARSYIGRCITYGQTVPGTEPGPSSVTAPIYIDKCNAVGVPPTEIDPLLQRIVVIEVNANHEVILQAGGKVVGVTANRLKAGSRLELQDYTGAKGQVWAYDGDSLMLAANRRLVAELENGRTPRGTAVVLGARDLDDSEFWTFVSVDGTYQKPTNGFVRVPEETDLRTALWQATQGTVIEIADDATIPLDDCSHPGACPPRQPVADFPLWIHEGVTIRSGRRGTRPGAELTVSTFEHPGILWMTAPYGRLTGLRLRGPQTGKDKTPLVTGIGLWDRVAPWGTFDHNELLGWTESAIVVGGPPDPDYDYQCEPPPGELPLAHTVRVVRNFIHHNARAGFGYGVGVGSNAFANILGNTFLYNRHAIGADGKRGTSYNAWYNLVLSDAPEYGFWGQAEQDFDMHGAEAGDDEHHDGGIAGSNVDIAWNTFLGTNPSGPDTRRNYELRGVPCDPHRFRRNVSRQSQSEALHWYGKPSPIAPPPPYLDVSGNKFSSPKPEDLGRGDFDGDGVQDLFLATGAAWYYSSGGSTEWRFLNNQTTKLTALRFGDIDADRRTDVLIKQGDEWSVCWAGASKRATINQRAGPIADFAVGDFDGDGSADLFHADGYDWFVSAGALGPFEPWGSVVTQPYRVAQLRFGDFNGDRRTDVFRVIGDGWYVLSRGSIFWTLLRSALEKSVSNLVIADFDGNGRSDVALANSWDWKVSYGGTANWTHLRHEQMTLKQVRAIGSFDGATGDDVIAWERVSAYPDVIETNVLVRYSGGSADPVHHSLHDMR